MEKNTNIWILVALFISLPLVFSDLSTGDKFSGGVNVQVSQTVQTATEIYDGTDLTGLNGATGRTLAFSDDIMYIIVDGYHLLPDTDYTYSGGVITFNNEMYNSMRIIITYII